jgi:hypothetical protein
MINAVKVIIWALGSISDHGTQFCADRRDKLGFADHRFEAYLCLEGIVQILCGVNHPQANGKIEKGLIFMGIIGAGMVVLMRWLRGIMISRMGV